MSTINDVSVPDIGDFKEVLVIEVLVRVGDTVAAEAPLLTLETDKATMDVPSPVAGKVVALRVTPGQRVSKGSPIAQIEVAPSTPASAPRAVSPAAPAATTAAGEPATAAPATEAPAAAAPASAAPASAAPASTGRAEPTLVRASPAVRKAAREQGIDLAAVAASGLGGRVSREDLDAHARQLAAPAAGAGLPAWPRVDHAQFGPVERRPLSRLRRIAGANLARNWQMIPHVTNFDEADITELEAFRTSVNREQGPGGTKVTLLAFLLKAAVAILQRHPTFNASLDGDGLVYKRYFHVGFAADTPDGLVVPVIRDVDRKGIVELAREAASLAAQAREGKLKLGDMQGGCFTVSSLGGIGGTGFTPIINAPEVAILGVNRAQMRPVWDGTQFQPRLMLPLSLSWDHRVIDGAAAARFLVDLAAVLADLRRTLL